MKYKHLILSGIAFAGAIALPLSMNRSGFAQMSPPPSGSDTAPTSPSTTPNSSSIHSLTSLDREFMKMAATGDLFELRTSQLALTKGNYSGLKN